MRRNVLPLALLWLVLAGCADLSSPMTAPTPTSSSATTLFPGLPPRSVSEDDLVTVLPRDAIPAIDDPPFVPADEAGDEMRPDEQIIGLTINSETHAYPINVLSSHEIANDRVGGTPVAVTWCPLCYTGIVFQRVVDEQELTFGVSGMLVGENLVMYDRQTDSLWLQLTGQAITGPLQGEQLRVLTATQTSWQTWRSQHPETLVIDKSALRQRFDRGDYAEVPGGSYAVDPYASYYNSPDRGVTESGIPRDPEVTQKQFVLGLRISGAAKAYPFKALGQQPVVNDELAGVPALVVFDEENATGKAFRRVVEGRTLTFTLVTALNGLAMRDDQTDTLWSGVTGEALEGELKGRRLEAIPTTLSFRFAWMDFYPDSAIYEGKQ